MTKILVIEDEADICAEVMQWLQYEHYTPIGAAMVAAVWPQRYMKRPT
jgi:DNA-binding response OmpR family regulator